MTNRFTDFAFAATDASADRTLPDRLADIHNVKDFGAVGDGVTDDWAAIAACYNATDYFATTATSNLVASFTGVVTSAFFTGTLSGNNLTTSSPTGTIAIGQTIRDHGVGGFTPCKIVSGSGSSWVVDGSPQTIGPGAMQTDNILVVSGVTGTISVGDWLINNGGTDASPSTVYPTYVLSDNGGGFYNLFQYTPQNAAGVLDTVLQNFTSQSMMTVSSTLNMSTTIASTLGQNCYDMNNTKFCGDGFSVNGGLTYVTSSSTITIYTAIGGLVNAGDTIAFQFTNKGEIYFPPGNYYVSQPIEFTAGGPHIIWRGTKGATTLSGNFDDFVLKQTNTSSAHTLIDGFHIVNSHATGGGIRLGGTATGMIRDCTIEANRALSDYGADSQIGGGYFGSFEITMDNCSMNAGANYAGSIGIAKLTDGPIRNCRVIGYEWGFLTASGQSGQSLLGCYFEKCGVAVALNRAPDGGSFAAGAISLIGCWLKNNSIGIEAVSSTALLNFLGNRIEGANGQAPGGANSQYGIKSGNLTGFQGNLATSMFAGITVVGAYDVAGILMSGKTVFVGGPTLIGVSDSATSPHQFLLNADFGNVYIPTQIGCSHRHIYTVDAIPVGNDNGQHINVSDGTNGLSWGDTLTGTGTHTTHYAAQWNGSSWTVVGK